MKTLLFIIALAALPFVSQAQTNIQIRVTVDGLNSNLNLDLTGSKKDQNRIAGIVYAYGVYTNSLGTNAPLAMNVWLRNQHTVLIDDYAAQKQSADNAAVLAKLQVLLTSQSDLLSNADLNNLATIAAKLP